MQKEQFKNIFDFQKKSKIKAGDGFKLGEAHYPFYTSSNVLTKSINEYQDIFYVDNCALVCKVKMKIIQEMLQIQRPIGWNLEQIYLISKEIARIEKYNEAKKN